MLIIGCENMNNRYLYLLVRYVGFVHKQLLLLRLTCGRAIAFFIAF